MIYTVMGLNNKLNKAEEKKFSELKSKFFKISQSKEKQKTMKKPTGYVWLHQAKQYIHYECPKRSREREINIKLT